MTLTETYFIGGTTYLLRFGCGNFEVVECDDFYESDWSNIDMSYRKVVFVGHLEKCKAFIKELEIAYLESRL